MIEKRKWVDPILVTANIKASEKYWAFLYSGMNVEHSGAHSFLCLRADKILEGRSFAELGRHFSTKKEKYENFWLGYLGYEMKNQVEKFPRDKKFHLNFPNSWFARFKIVIIFDHKIKNITIYNHSKENLDYLFSVKKKNTRDVKLGALKLRSNMKKEEYLKKVRYIKEAIKHGDLYQANLTRKFYGTFRKKIFPFDIFRKLCRISPSPYSAFIRFRDKFIISSSPESFIKINSSGFAETRPIKGTAPNQAKALKKFMHSTKNRAENLMIVDLMRNDFARSCEAGSIKVESLFDVTSYSAVHHMSSTVTGQKSKNISTINFVKNCFPPGSMTGAPKIKAIEICSDLEKLERGVYSGVLGWFGGDGSADLSVIIRTLLLDGKKFEFQVGGAIVADSKPKDELKETFYKAAAICQTLGISMEKLKRI